MRTSERCSNADLVWRWATNGALAVFVVTSVMEPGGATLDGAALFGLGLVFGIDIMRGRKRGWS